MVEKQENKKWSGFAIAGFILSLLFYTALLGLIFSAIGLSDTSKNKKKGRGLAIAGLTIGIIIVSLVLIGIVWVVVRNIAMGA